MEVLQLMAIVVRDMVSNICQIGKEDAWRKTLGLSSQVRKMNYKIIMIFVITLALISAANAQNVQSVTATSSASSATTGTNIVVTATSTSDTGDVSNTQIALVKDSGSGDFSVSDPAGGSYSGITVTTSGVTKTFTFTAGTAGTYTYKVTDTWSGGSKSSTAATLEFVAPSALTTTADPSSKTQSQGSSFTLSLSVQNPQGSNVLTSYSLSTPSQFSVSGDPSSSSGTTINAGTTKTLTWTVTTSTCYTGSKDITFALGGNSAAATVTITSGNSSCTSSSNTSSSSSSSSGGSSSSSVAKKSVAKITAGSSETISFSEANIDSITIKVKNTVSNIEVSVTEGAKPSGAPEPSLVDADIVLYKYIEIAHVNISNSDTDSAIIRFKVPQDWLKSNNINPGSVELWRYTTQWDKLPTTKTTETDLNVFYEATSPGLSTFIITAKKIQASAPVSAETNQTQQAANQTSTSPISQADLTILIISFIVLIVLIAGGYLYFHKFNTEEQRVKRMKKKFEYKRN